MKTSKRGRNELVHQACRKNGFNPRALSLTRCRPQWIKLMVQRGSIEGSTGGGGMTIFETLAAPGTARWFAANRVKS